MNWTSRHVVDCVQFSSAVCRLLRSVQSSSVRGNSLLYSAPFPLHTVILLLEQYSVFDCFGGLLYCRVRTLYCVYLRSLVDVC